MMRAPRMGGGPGGEGNRGEGRWLQRAEDRKKKYSKRIKNSGGSSLPLPLLVPMATSGV